MLEAVKVALDPTPEQVRALNSHAGAARYTYNAALAHVKAQLESRESDDTVEVPWNLYALRRWWNGSKDVSAPWWADNSKEAYNSGLDAVARSLKNFSDSRSGKRKGPRMGFPQFKSRSRARKSFQYTTGSFGVADPYGVKLPRIGRVHTHERIDGRVHGAKIKRVSISETGGRWYASFTIEREAAPASKTLTQREAVGIDLGVKTLATLSTGEVLENPKHLRSAQTKLARLGRAYARTQKGSNGRRKCAGKLARAHNRVKNLRQDAIHKMTSDLASRFGTLVIEDLNVAGMVKNHSLARSVSDAAFGEIRRQLEYKVARRGGTVVLADRWFPSSKKCSSCGVVKAKLHLQERVFDCANCGVQLDRDVNAALNLKQLVAGSGPETQNGDGGDVRPALVQADPYEVSTTQGLAVEETADPQDVDRRLVTTASLTDHC